MFYCEFPKATGSYFRRPTSHWVIPRLRHIHRSGDLVHHFRLSCLSKHFIWLSLVIELPKCSFVVTVLCLGCVINSKNSGPRDISQSVNAHSPTNVYELRSVIGVLRYYTRFIWKFAKTAYCLLDIISSNSFLRSALREKVLRDLLSRIQPDVVSKRFSPNTSPALITDGSPTGMCFWE